MILRIRDIHALARDVVIDNGNLVFARMIASGEEARAIAYFAAHKGGYVNAHPHLGWVRIQDQATQVSIQAVTIQGNAQKIITLYLPALFGRRYFIAPPVGVEKQFRRFLHTYTPYPLPRRMLPPERWGEELEKYDTEGLVALAFGESDIRELLKEASNAY